ncbi:ATPase [Mycobacterium sp. CVI_P3]|uniref:ATPase n=1 Tax=Mycobacterium pinniadriaticum TaxID=2994102 RepID=A0ABT3S734_9MYCO|nr:ATPase [Mycobacterium pinniadriaticum]MCX2928827.1 ATPase [Mycobacterium pinniadriaticum]MCX2935306.1 ATPase [Mycobacterium pinniadriaticum]
MPEMRQFHVYDCARMGRRQIVRLVIAVLLVACGLAVAPPAAAEPNLCPPNCDRIPDAAWIAPWAVPLNARYTWPRLAAVAVTATVPRFRFEELCGTPPVAADPRAYAVAERASVVNPVGQWQLQATVVHWRGETWRGGELAEDVFQRAVAALRSCQRTDPLASPSLTVDQPDRMAAVISGPVILHQYLVASPANSTITELALWSTAPPLTPWPTDADADVLDALGAPLCTAYIGSCP